MRSIASRREELEKKLFLLREEQKRELKAFNELADACTELKASEIVEAARKKAEEEEPKSLSVGDTVISVGSDIFTLDDLQTLLREEKGIFSPDLVKRVYLGEKGRVMRVLPSIYEKPAVELRFADGAVKTFLTSCLALGSNPKRPLQTSTGSVPASKPVHVDPSAIRVTEVVERPPEPESFPNYSWDTIQLPRRVSKMGSFTPAQRTETALTNINDVQLIKKGCVKNGGTKDAKSNFDGQSVKTFTVPVTAVPLEDSSKAIGLLKEVLSPPEQSLANEERLGSPLIYDERRPMPLVGSVEQDCLFKTPRAELIHTSKSIKVPPATDDWNYSSSIPTSCPKNYKAKFSLSDKSTGIPRLDGVSPTSFGIKRCRVAGKLRDQTDLQFVPLVVRQSDDTLERVLSQVTQALNWRSKGLRARCLFNTDGVEIKQVNDIQDGMSFIACTVHAHFYNVGQGPGAGRTQLNVKATRSAISTEGASQVGNQGSRFSTALPSVSSTRSLTDLAREKRQEPQEQEGVKEVIRKKGVSKPISVRVFENGEYGDRRNDRFPFRTVTIRPMHKTIRAVFNTIERELEWHTLKKKIEIMYDATGCEITSVEELTDGQAIVVSEGDNFVIPHSYSVIHDDVRKISRSTVFTSAAMPPRM